VKRGESSGSTPPLRRSASTYRCCTGAICWTTCPRSPAQAPSKATLVVYVYHTAVLAYVDEDKRRAFAVADLGAVWLSNEAEGVLPNLDLDQHSGTFVLVRDGTDVLARTDPHGTWVEWADHASAR
jgi:hypothetical protein